VNTPTLIAYLVMAAVLVVLVFFVLRAMMRGWLAKASSQAGQIGRLPGLPDSVSAPISGPMPGLYVGSTMAPQWLNRIAFGDLGFRSKAVLTRFPEGIMVKRSGATPIWIPDESITEIRPETGLAGKVVPPDGILAIRCRQPAATEIDTGFRGDDRRSYDDWLREAKE